jgi:hypothetical protein
MRALVFLALLFLLAAIPASAWDGPALWQEATNADYGGGGIWGTGGKQDFGINCTHCHQRPAGMPTPSVDLQFTFNPLLVTAGGTRAYQPNTRYTVTVKMTGETLGFSCDPGMPNNNGFSTAFELSNGQRAGRYESDWGQDSNACPSILPSYVNSGGYTIYVTDGGTVTYGSCHAVAASSLDSQSTRYFFWTAPPAGSGAVTVFYGVVDGNCDMNSQNDDARATSFTLAEGT